jgi:hypothetical protein
MHALQQVWNYVNIICSATDSVVDIFWFRINIDGGICSSMDTTFIGKAIDLGKARIL